MATLKNKLPRIDTIIKNLESLGFSVEVKNTWHETGPRYARGETRTTIGNYQRKCKRYTVRKSDGKIAESVEDHEDKWKESLVAVIEEYNLRKSCNHRTIDVSGVTGTWFCVDCGKHSGYGPFQQPDGPQSQSDWDDGEDD